MDTANKGAPVSRFHPTKALKNQQQSPPKDPRAKKSRPDVDLELNLDPLLTNDGPSTTVHIRRKPFLHGIVDTFNTFSKETPTGNKPSTTREARPNVILKTWSKNTKHQQEVNKLSLRDKRLYNAEQFRLSCQKDNSATALKSPGSQLLNSSTHSKFSPLRDSSTDAVLKRQDNDSPLYEKFFDFSGSETVSRPVSRFPNIISQEMSSATPLSRETSLFTPSLFGQSQQRFRKVAESSTTQREDWSDYCEKATEPLMKGRTARTATKTRHASEDKREKKRSIVTEEALSRIKPTYSKLVPDLTDNFSFRKWMIKVGKSLEYAKFLESNFEDDMINRITTFQAFAFTTVEKDENKEIPVFFHETKKAKESAGSMGVVDLWSGRLRKELASRAGFSKEKKMVEKFLFYKARDRREPLNMRKEFAIMHRKNENVYKDIIARQELAEYVKKNQNMELRSSMVRHMSMKGKQFVNGTESKLLHNVNTVNSGTLNVTKDLTENFDSIIRDLNKFAEENQDDYIKYTSLSPKSRHKKAQTKEHKRLADFTRQLE